VRPGKSGERPVCPPSVPPSVLLTLVLVGSTPAQDSSVHCSGTSCTGSADLGNGTYVHTDCNDSDCSSYTLNQSYTQRLCYSCTAGETARSRAQVRLCFALIDFTFCNTMLQEDDRALKIEMQRGAEAVRQLGVLVALGPRAK
jgi:hypothetical protein